jgi:hypothetical protein
VRGWRVTIAAGAVALAVSACGGAATQSAGEPHGAFRIVITQASFPAHQRLAQPSELVIAVRNAGRRAIPDIAVTLVNPRYGTAAQALGRLIAPNRQGRPILASRSRPVWVIDREPGPCEEGCGSGGPGGAAGSYSNTWTLGSLAPGDTARFDWHVTAVQAGSYTVVYEVAADPNGGRARAVGAGGGSLAGRFRVEISSGPPVPYVTPSGRVKYRG